MKEMRSYPTKNKDSHRVDKQSGPMMMQGAIVLRLRQVAIIARIR